jgi:hypothetical protein
MVAFRLETPEFTCNLIPDSTVKENFTKNDKKSMMSVIRAEVGGRHRENEKKSANNEVKRTLSVYNNHCRTKARRTDDV